MAEQVSSRRAPYWVAGAGAVSGTVAALSMTGDIIFNVFNGPTAIAVCGGVAVLVGGLAWYLMVRTQQQTVAPAPAAPRSVPRHDLPGAEPWVGREVLLDGLLALLRDVPAPTGGALAVRPMDSQSKIFVVHGAPGTGKTTLALNAAHRVRDEYPDGQLYLELRGDGDEPRTSADALERLLLRLDVAREDIPADAEDRAALLRTLTNDRRLLFVLDNAHSTEQVRPLLPVGSGCAVLITSRKALSAGDVTRPPVQVFLPDENEALDVLAHYAGQDRIAADPAVALQIALFCGRLPLALRIVGSKLKHRPDLSLARMRTRLEDERHRLRELVHDDKSLEACLGFTHRELEESTRTAFGLIATLPVGRLTDWHFASVVGAGRAGVAACDELIEVSLMEARDDDGGDARYHVHDLIRVYAAEQYDHLPPDEQQRLEARLVRAFRNTVVHLAARRAPELAAEVSPEQVDDLDRSSAAAWVSDEQERLQWAVARGRSLGMDTEAAEIGEALSYFLDDITLAAGAADWLFSTPSGARPRVQGSLRRARAAAALAEGAPDTALTLLATGDADAGETTVTDPVPVDRARDEMVVARAHAAKNDFREALRHMTAAVERLRTAQDSWHVLNSLEKLGEFQRWRGKPELAEQSQREALRLAEHAGDLRARARLQRTLAETLGYLRRPEEAAPLLESAVHDFRFLNDRRWEGACRYALGKIYRLLGRRDDALDCYRRAEEIFGPMGERHWVGRVTNAKIRVLAGMGNLDEAAATASTAFGIFQQLGDEMWSAHTQRDVGWLHLKAGRPGEALEPLTHAVDVTGRAGDAYAGAMAHHLRGVAHRDLGHYPEAYADFEAALTVYRSGDYEWNEAAVVHDLVRALRSDGRTEEAETLNTATAAANPIFVRLHGRNGAEAVPDED
ncbi:tetratricopeptide repeat protein [Streptomyces acidicola]|uniref:Tetratricopeptide repeat protein n=1 Tax=Streptomyces acidicola TaxID=2596892 RepID=A0A5N8WT09_9ACTN|nr:tetratricopeptide repeat protein [Streptomyces acidicola]MPY50409.1 tetratricopeptide repeat protein [Streptomyces acidicola]